MPGLTEEQYKLLCEACDRLLLASDSTVERVAIPWLHIIREHPVFLANYVDLFAPVKNGRAIFRKWWSFFRKRAGWLRQITRILRASGQPWFGPNELPQGVDFLFVSHLLNESQAGNTEDFYFAGLANELVARGHSALIALINHTGKDARPMAAKWNGYPVPRIIFSDSLRLIEELDLRRRLKNESVRMRQIAQIEQPGLLRSVIARASEEAFSGGALTALRMASQIGALVDMVQPKAIVVTHEGHAWERMAFASSRKSSKDVFCIGYQHAALFQLQHAIRRNLSSQYNPDNILTAGKVGKKELEGAPGLNGIPITVLGSNRSFKGTAIGGVRKMQPGKLGHFDDLSCLVIPEGITSECHLLFEFSLACARFFPEVQFIWRLHPIVTYESLKAQNPKLKNLPRNIFLSKAALEDDIARCRWTLYRGTTVVVQAVVAGLRPIYLRLPGEMTIDPLYELKGWRVCVETIGDFHRVITDDQNGLTLDGESESRASAEDYCGDFFTFLNPDVLEDILVSKDNF
jgi:hypothetical protein